LPLVELNFNFLSVQKMNVLKKFATLFFLAFFLLTTGVVNAEGGGEGGKEGGGGSALLAKVEPIVVNLTGPTQQYIQVEMTLKLAKPEVAEKIKLYMPVIRHKMILLLTSKDAAELGPLEGKQKLLQQSKEAVNQALELSEKEGVTDVLFSSFIIQ